MKKSKNKQRKEKAEKHELPPDYDSHEALIAMTLRKRGPQNDYERTLLAEIREIEANGAEVEIPNELP